MNNSASFFWNAIEFEITVLLDDVGRRGQIERFYFVDGLVQTENYSAGKFFSDCFDCVERGAFADDEGLFVWVDVFKIGESHSATLTRIIFPAS